MRHELALRAGASALGLLLIVTACGSPTSTTATVSSSAPASPSASPAASSLAPSPAVRASATTGDGDAIIAAFFDSFAASDEPFHVLSEVTFSGTAEGQEVFQGEIVVEGDVSGEDFAGDVSGDVSGEAIESEVITAGGTTYGRQPGGEWQEAPSSGQTQPLNPFGNLEAEDTEYVGTDERGGRPVHHLRTTEWIGGDPASTGIPDAAIEESAFDIFVDDVGLPVEADLTFTLSGVNQGTPFEAVYEVHYVFSEVGVPVTIEAPDVD